MKTNLLQPIPELPVKNVEEAQAYYRDFLGFDITWLYHDKSIGAVARGDVGFFFRLRAEISPNVFWLAAPDVDATYIEMKNSGAKIIDHIENKPWNTRQFTIEDLNGHIFYVYNPTE